MNTRNLRGSGLALAGALFCCTAAAGETFELNIHGYCTVANCGFPDFASYRDTVKDIVQEMNLQWEPTGISFRPNVLEIESDTKFTALEGCKDVPYEPEKTTLKAKWIEEVAQTKPAAISLALSETGSNCCSSVPQPAPQTDPDDVVPNCAGGSPDVHGFFCVAPGIGASIISTGSLLAHEMGHHWCLIHTHTGDDYAKTAPAQPNHDPDSCYDPDPKDTPPDPYAKEAIADQAGYDKQIAKLMANNGLSQQEAENEIPKLFDEVKGELLDDHEWCEFASMTNAADPNSPHSTFCTIEKCVKREMGETSETEHSPATYAAMSYYHKECSGPVVINGVRFDAFGPHSIEHIRDCRNHVEARRNLPDVCQFSGGDSDHDGICDANDGCPEVMDTAQRNRDEDEVPDACDPCPDVSFWSGGGDIDGDDVCDDLDADRDGDGCFNVGRGILDQHPNEANPVVGELIYLHCGSKSEPLTIHEATHSDQDGIPNCQDGDDDDDGIPDLDDPCPAHEGTTCTFPVVDLPCPALWQEVCRGTDCVEKGLFLRFKDPTNELIFPSFQILGGTIYLPALSRRTISESALAIGARSSQVRLEIWSRPENRLVALVGEYLPSEILFDVRDVTRAAFIAVTPGERELRIGGRHAIGAGSGDPVPDVDSDGISDTADNCVSIGNGRQVDADNDGFGNACDADFDGDLRVRDNDLGEVRRCQGADLTLDAGPFAGGFDPPGLDPDPEALRLAGTCRAADLDESGLVDAADLRIAELALGGAPGPSARRDLTLYMRLDVLPGVADNLINPGSKGVTPVAILSGSALQRGFDATQVDPGTVCFGAAARPGDRSCAEVHGRGHIEDVDGDGVVDLVLHYRTAATGLRAGDSAACVTGRTREGTPVLACDRIGAFGGP